MTRIDEALRRKSEQRDVTPPPLAPAAATGEDDPWHVSTAVPEETAAVSEGLLPDDAKAVALGDARRPHGRTFEKLVGEGSGLTAAAVEQYRRLAANLHHAQADRGIKSVLVCSALKGEGKSLTATNVALTLSGSYRRRVLLVDADLRRPSLHRVFEVPETNGLSDGLVADEDQKLPLVQLSDHLTLLPAGRPTPDPMASLSSGRMRHILTEAREAFDWVIVDTPPIAVLTDASLLAAMVDTAVLVIQAARTPLAAARKALETLGRDRVIGVVLNGADRQRHSGYYSDYYSGFYGTE